MADLLQGLQAGLGTGADAALIIIAAAIYKLDRRVLKLEMRLNQRSSV